MNVLVTGTDGSYAIHQRVPWSYTHYVPRKTSAVHIKFLNSLTAIGVSAKVSARR
jgi:hypothetical protein